jgi:two-component sensor histidine kinase
LFPFQNSFAIPDRATFFGLTFATVSELLVLLVLALYQREVAAARARRQRQINFLGQALREIDHRTQNNFQIVLSIIELQASRSGSPDASEALLDARNRIRAVARAYERLALRSAGLEKIKFEEHLEDLCAQLRLGVLPDAIELRTELVPTTLRAQDAINLGIVANELITNAVKHAFGTNRGTILVRTSVGGGWLELSVRDNGLGMPPPKARRAGLGSRLIKAFVHELGATHTHQSSEAGTVHLIRLPYGRPRD